MVSAPEVIWKIALLAALLTVASGSLRAFVRAGRAGTAGPPMRPRASAERNRRLVLLLVRQFVRAVRVSGDAESN